MKLEEKYDSVALMSYLKKIEFIGPFPRGIEVLLVPIEPALQEAKGLYPNLTKNKLIDLLRKESVFIFKSAEEWGEMIKQARISK